MKKANIQARRQRKAEGMYFNCLYC